MRGEPKPERRGSMTRSLSVCVLTAILTVACGAAQLPNNVPPWLAQAKLVGPSDGNGQAAVAMYLQLTNVAGLEALIHDLCTPGTASYGRFLTPEQFQAAYSPP